MNRIVLGLFSLTLFLVSSGIVLSSVGALPYPKDEAHDATKLAYRIMLELNTTSPWTNVYFRSGAQIAASRVSIVEGKTPELWVDAVLSDSSIRLGYNPPEYYPPKVSLRIVLILFNMTENGEVIVEVQKGCIGDASLILYNYNQETLRSVSASTAGPNPCSAASPGVAWQRFAFDAAYLRQGGPMTTIQSSRQFGKLVWAFYYPWYTPEDWNEIQPPMLIDKPLAGPYDSSDPNVIEQHIRTAKSAGIDGFITSWGNYLPGSPRDLEDINLRTLLDVASRDNFKVTIYFESCCLEPGDRPKTEALLEQQLRNFFLAYEKDPRYFRIDGLPVIFIYAVNSQNASVWHEIVQRMETEGHKAFYVADTDRPEYLETFQGMHTYFPPLEDDPDKLYHDLSEYYQELSFSARIYPALYPKQESTPLWAATVVPGYDERHLARRSTNFYPRENGAIYNATFRAAVASDPDWILITSFNEWWENTYIEPSETYGWRYIDLTTTYSSEFKKVTFSPSLSMSRTVSVTGQEGNLNVLITNIGNGSAVNIIAIDRTPGQESSQNIERILPGEKASYVVAFSIPFGQTSLELPPGEVTFKDIYESVYRTPTNPVLQYHLSIVSLHGSTAGTGWYETGTVASFSVSPTSLSMSGLLGVLGARYVFESWSGDLKSTSPNATIVMDAPKTVTATWQTDYTQLYIIVGIMIILISLIAIATYIKKRSAKVRRTVPEYAPTRPS